MLRSHGSLTVLSNQLVVLNKISNGYSIRINSYSDNILVFSHVVFPSRIKKPDLLLLDY